MTTVEQTYTSLLDPVAFPTFKSCPHEEGLSLTYTNQHSSPPIRHWCFLGEIKEISGIGRLCLDVKDREGRTVRIYFYLDKLHPSKIEMNFTIKTHNAPVITYPGHPNVPPYLVQKGNTIAVLYAQRHPWIRESSTGIRIEDGDRVQMFACGLNKLLGLSDQIMRGPQLRASESQGCNRCAKNGVSLQRCSACRFTWYCSKYCQKVHWFDGGHKKDCKLTNQVKLLMRQKWDHFETYLEFPLIGL